MTKHTRKTHMKITMYYYIHNESTEDIYISNLWDVIVEKSKSKNDGFLKKKYAVGSRCT